jgi:hypothetical protein
MIISSPEETGRPSLLPPPGGMFSAPAHPLHYKCNHAPAALAAMFEPVKPSGYGIAVFAALVTTQSFLSLSVHFGSDNLFSMMVSMLSTTLPRHALIHITTTFHCSHPHNHGNTRTRPHTTTLPRCGAPP